MNRVRFTWSGISAWPAAPGPVNVTGLFSVQPVTLPAEFVRHVRPPGVVYYHATTPLVARSELVWFAAQWFRAVMSVVTLLEMAGER